jgi:hypothetical protein
MSEKKDVTVPVSLPPLDGKFKCDAVFRKLYSFH